MELREEVARGLAGYIGPEFDRLPADRVAARALGDYSNNETQDSLLEVADAAIAIVLRKVERHLSAVQYDPAPYTALKHRLAALKARKADNG